MRQRISYILPSGLQVDPEAVSLGPKDFVYRNAHAAAEERKITIGLEELPQELQNVFENCHEVRIRVGRPYNHNAFPPQVSRVSPGLHLFLTPNKPDKKDECCVSLSNSLVPNLQCGKQEGSLTRLFTVSERFANSPTFQFYMDVATLEIESQWKTRFCRRPSSSAGPTSLCDLLSVAKYAAYIDLDFDVISHAVTITALWTPTSPSNNRDERMSASKHTEDDRLEVGVFQVEKAESEEHISLSGVLTVVGQDDHYSPTLFSFPSRHHPLPETDQTTFTAQFQQPIGLHPKFELTFPSTHLTAPKPTCSLYTYWTLPSTTFLDRYQLSDPLFLASQNLAALHSLTGEQDLEAPNWAVSRWGSAALLELAVPPPNYPKTGNWTVTIPTHLRYVKGSGKEEEDRFHSKERIPWPVVFWACDAEEGLKMGTNPFDRVNLGYDGLFGPKTMFYHVPPAPGGGAELVETLRVPILDRDWMGYIPLGTAGVVLLGFAWVCWKLIASVGIGREDEVEKKKQ